MLSDEQMRKRLPFSLLNDEQMSNKVGVEHQRVVCCFYLFPFPPFFLGGGGWLGCASKGCHIVEMNGDILQDWLKVKVGIHTPGQIIEGPHTTKKAPKWW